MLVKTHQPRYPLSCLGTWWCSFFHVYLNTLPLALVKLFPFLCIKLFTISATRLQSTICIHGSIIGAGHKWCHLRKQ